MTINCELLQMFLRDGTRLIFSGDDFYKFEVSSDGIHLEKINLTSVEWDAISILTAVLRPFTEATELLEGSKYATISFMYSVITVIEQRLISTSGALNMDLKVPSNKAMLATLLDLWCKPLSFMLESLKNQTFELLNAKYEKSQILYRIEENNNVQNYSNSLLASIFHNRCPRLEVSDYLGAQEIL
ncbi:11227_t:CDS:2 [Cetraspora pellucida]|uniref:11227_t:CDS:1 n=1 Tax=Cetraspora pellucida TaxID=1433469 RepID=A0ACA9MYU0_9GLOM|nr:11227_t:CDS:2 [Cetraspora pellucida]